MKMEEINVTSTFTFIHFPDFLPLNETINCLIIDIFANMIIDAINIFVKKHFLYFALI